MGYILWQISKGVSKEEVLKLMRDHVPVPTPTPRGGTGMGKDEVNKLVQEALAATHEENAERNAQVIGDCRSSNFAPVWTQRIW